MDLTYIFPDEPLDGDPVVIRDPMDYIFQRELKKALLDKRIAWYGDCAVDILPHPLDGRVLASMRLGAIQQVPGGILYDRRDMVELTERLSHFRYLSPLCKPFFRQMTQGTGDQRSNIWFQIDFTL